MHLIPRYILPSHFLSCIGVGAQSTLGGHEIFARKKCMKNNKMPEFYMFHVRKVSKIPEFLLYLPEKLTKFPNWHIENVNCDP